jgi:phage regulator Rha-like protein
MTKLSTLNNTETLSMSSVEIATLTGKEHFNVLADIRKMLPELGYKTTDFSGVYKDQQLINRPCFNLPKRETLILVSGYSIVMRAKIIDRWQELEKQVSLEHNVTELDKAKISFLLLESASKTLKLSNSALLHGYKVIAESSGVSFNILPTYVVDSSSDTSISSDVTASATELLKEFNSSLSTVKLNKLLGACGILEQHTRPSTSSATGKKKFWVIVDTTFGKNVTSDNNPKETQPLWYRHKFKELLLKVSHES